MRASRIKVRKPDPATGELVEEVVPADHFASKLPARPKPRPQREFPCSRAWQALHAFDHLEAEAEYWAAHSDCLSREERRLLASEHSSVLRPVRPTWRKGEVLRVANNVEAKVGATEWTLRGWRTVFKVTDHRAWLLKQTVGGGGRPRVDAHGYPADLTSVEKDRARVDGAYTRSPALSVPDAGEVMDDKLHRHLHAEQSMANAMKQTKQRIRLDGMRLEMRLDEARKKKWRSTVRYLERVQQHHERKKAA